MARRKENRTCGSYRGGKYCQQDAGHRGPCDAPVPKPICGEYTDDGTYCQQHPDHSGDHK